LDMAGDNGVPSAPSTSSQVQDSLEAHLASKVATLERFHEEVKVQVVASQEQHHGVVAQVTARKGMEWLQKRLEPSFVCPILQKRLVQPVLAADGHTYEQEAMERWIQTHGTSPLTGEPLAHRHLTDNFALKQLMNLCDAGRYPSSVRKSSSCGGGDGLKVSSTATTGSSSPNLAFECSGSTVQSGDRSGASHRPHMLHVEERTTRNREPRERRPQPQDADVAEGGEESATSGRPHMLAVEESRMPRRRLWGRQPPPQDFDVT